MKLSKAQQVVVDLMNDGWEMGHYTGLSGGYRIQKGGLGKGGDSRHVHTATAHALIDRQVVVPTEGGAGFPITARYVLNYTQ